MNNLKVFCILLVCNGLHASLFKGPSCQKVRPMSGFDLNKFIGDWYLLITNRGAVNQGESCFRSTHVIVDDGVLQTRQNWIAADDAIRNAVVKFQFNKESTGVFVSEEKEKVRGLFSTHDQTYMKESVIIDTDYENYLLRYSCYEVEHFWIAEKKEHFYISLRNRQVDLRPILSLFNKLRDQLKFNLNEIDILNNTVACEN